MFQSLVLVALLSGRGFQDGVSSLKYLRPVFLVVASSLPPHLPIHARLTTRTSPQGKIRTDLFAFVFGLPLSCRMKTCLSLLVSSVDQKGAHPPPPAKVADSVCCSSLRTSVFPLATNQCSPLPMIIHHCQYYHCWVVTNSQHNPSLLVIKRQQLSTIFQNA